MRFMQKSMRKFKIIIAILLLLAIGSSAALADALDEALSLFSDWDEEDTQSENTETVEVDPGAELVYTGSSVLNTVADLRVGCVVDEGAQLNPFVCTEQDYLNIQPLVFESVVELNDELKPVPLLADSWTLEDTTWTFKLRSGIQFHNGAMLTAEDVYQSYQQYLLAGETNPWYARLSLIKEMRVIDDTTLEVEATGTGLMTLYAMTFPVVQRDTVNDMMPRGTGPYWITEFVRGTGFRLERNPLWWKNDPEIQSVVCIRYEDTGAALTALATGEINLLSTRSNTAALTRQTSNVVSLDYATTTYEMLVPNLDESSVMSDVNMRKAVMYAIDRATLVSNAYLGMGVQCEVPVNPSSWLYESQSAVYYYSPERALQLIQQLGWEDLTGDGMMNKQDGVRLYDLELKLYTYNEPTNQIRENAANLIRLNLEKIGITVNVYVVSKARCLQRIKDHTADIALIGVNLSEIPMLNSLFESKGDLNLNNGGSEAMKTELEKAYNASDEDTLIQAMSAIQLLVTERLPVLGLLWRSGTVLATRSLSGLSGLRSGNSLNGIEFMSLQ